MHTSLFLFCSLSTLVQPLPFVAMLPWPRNAAQAGTSRLPTPGQATDGSCQAFHASSDIVHICAVCVCILCRECGVLDLNGTSATSTQYSLYSCRFACSTLQLFSDCTEVSTSCSGWNTLTLLCPAWSKSKQTITRGTLRCVQFMAWVLTRAWSCNCGSLIAWPIFTWFISLHLPSFAFDKEIFLRKSETDFCRCFLFEVEIFMLDTNMMDSHPKHADPRHNICGQQNNPPGASCSATGGPKDLDDCFKFMWDTWLHQKTRHRRSRQRHPTLKTYKHSVFATRLWKIRVVKAKR